MYTGALSGRVRNVTNNVILRYECSVAARIEPSPQ